VTRPCPLLGTMHAMCRHTTASQASHRFCPPTAALGLLPRTRPSPIRVTVPDHGLSILTTQPAQCMRHEHRRAARIRCLPRPPSPSYGRVRGPAQSARASIGFRVSESRTHVPVKPCAPGPTTAFARGA
jgi:hypothetical protein